jgi:isocitrate lyase
VLFSSLSDVYWCWDKPRAREGYYRFDGGIEACIVRAIAYAPYGQYTRDAGTLEQQRANLFLHLEKVHKLLDPNKQ